MSDSYDKIKAKMRTILQSERAIEFLNDLTNDCFSIGNAVQITNKFIKKVFQREGIENENKHNRISIINNIIIDNKKNYSKNQFSEKSCYFLKEFWV